MGDLLPEFPSSSRDSSQEDFTEIHPIVSAAADGDLPPWTRAGPRRRDHMARVSNLLAGWAEGLSLRTDDRVRWASVGHLHDLLRDAPEVELRSHLADGLSADADASGGWRPDPSAFRLPGSTAGARDRDPSRPDAVWDFDSVPAPLLHGPAASVLLAGAGVDDEEILAAVAYHTVGHPDLGALGRALICADFLEPGREGSWEDDPELREAFPADPGRVIREVIRRKVRYRIDAGEPIFEGTVGSWNRLTRES